MSTIYVVVKETDYYEYDDVNVKAFALKSEAEKFVAAANKEQKKFARKLKKLREKYDYMDNLPFWQLAEPTEKDEQEYQMHQEKFGEEYDALVAERIIDKESSDYAIYKVQELELVE